PPASGERTENPGQFIAECVEHESLGNGTPPPPPAMAGTCGRSEHPEARRLYPTAIPSPKGSAGTPYRPARNAAGTHRQPDIPAGGRMLVRCGVKAAGGLAHSAASSPKRRLTVVCRRAKTRR